MLEYNRPITLCVIDDIEPVVEGICQKIEWVRYGITVVGGASNGEEGLELIIAHKPDIILTDIRMPIMNGLELATEALKLVPHSKVILISGYTDFEYAQQALRLGAFDFIAKPFSLEEIVTIVLKAKLELEEERHKFLDEQLLKKKVKDSLPLLRQEYLNLLLHHSTTEEHAVNRWDFLGIDMELECFIVMVVEIDQFSERFKDLPVQEIELIFFSLQNILEETINTYTKGVFFKESSSRFVCMMNPPLETSTHELAEKCRAHVETYTKFTVSIGLGEQAEQLRGVHHSYHQAIQALSYHFYTGGNGVMSQEDMQTDFVKSPTYHFDREHGLFFAFRTGNAVETLRMLDEIEKDLLRLKPLPRPEYLSSLYFEIIYMLLRILQEKVAYSKIEALEANVHQLKLNKASTLNDLQLLLKSLCQDGCQLIEKSRISESEQIVEVTRKYIRANLDQDLTVNHCAQNVHMSGSYFANVFKKVTGATLNQYVTLVRMEKAKEMLLDGYQVQEIAPILGYEDRRYFSDAFRKQTGMTPSEYKKHTSEAE